VGDKVVGDDDELALLMTHCPKAIAVAMEGFGVAKAVAGFDLLSPRFLEIRGISDYADKEKNDGWHEFAANSAAEFTIDFLKTRPIAGLASSAAPSHQLQAIAVPQILVQEQSPIAHAAEVELLWRLVDDVKAARRGLATDTSEALLQQLKSLFESQGATWPASLRLETLLLLAEHERIKQTMQKSQGVPVDTTELNRLIQEIQNGKP
jgi:hypothetical protein